MRYAGSWDHGGSDRAVKATDEKCVMPEDWVRVLRTIFLLQSSMNFSEGSTHWGLLPCSKPKARCNQVSRNQCFAKPPKALVRVEADSNDSQREASDRVKLGNREQRCSRMNGGGHDATGAVACRMSPVGVKLDRRITHIITSGKNLLDTRRCFMDH